VALYSAHSTQVAWLIAAAMSRSKIIYFLPLFFIHANRIQMHKKQ